MYQIRMYHTLWYQVRRYQVRMCHTLWYQVRRYQVRIMYQIRTYHTCRCTINSTAVSLFVYSLVGGGTHDTYVPPVHAHVWRQLHLSAVARCSDSYCIFWSFVMSLTSDQGGSKMQCGRYIEWMWVLQFHEWSYDRRTKVGGDTVIDYSHVA